MSLFEMNKISHGDTFLQKERNNRRQFWYQTGRFSDQIMDKMAKNNKRNIQQQ